MRNMKRALSLVLTMVMLLGMVMIPTGAVGNFADAALIENTEAVAITSGIGLFAGTSDGNFAPKATVTRAQMATIIVKMLRGNEFNADAFKGVDKFPDTASFEGGWAEGYINACVQLGVVAGYGDGTFKPGRELTTAEAITMIINALGIDPGAGEWPVNYMAKAEALKLYGDLVKKPGTNEPLSRDQLAVIVWEGLQYSPEGKSGYKIPGSDLIFTDIADAVLANGNNFEGITEAVGQDSLASKVYEIKTATGWITGNAATGESCTVLTSASGVETNYAMETGVDMLGHYVTIYYNEQYKNDEDPGLVYTIVDESTVVTVKEAINTAKEYKAAFGKNINEAQNGFVFDNNYVATDLLSDDMNVPGYTAGSAAPKGTYIITDGVIVTYIEPATVYASYVVDIDNAADNETIWINDANGDTPIPNAEGDDQIVEYAGVKIGDFVTYVKVQDVFVLSPVEKVTGTVTKTASTELDGEDYETITIDGTAYPAFEPKGTSPSNNKAKLDTTLSDVDYGQTYTLYVTEDGHYIGFEAAGSTISMDNTVFLLGTLPAPVKEKDQYGKVTFVNKARGIDMDGKEVMLTIGKAKDVNGNGTYQIGEDADALGSMDTVLQGYYTYELSTDKDEKKEEIQVLSAYAGAYSPETPTYTLKANTTTGTFNGSGSIATMEGIPAFGTGKMKFFVVDGSVSDSAPLTVTAQIPSGFHIDSTQNSYYLLVTRAANGASSNIEAFIYMSSEKVGKDVYFRATQEQVDTPSRTVDGTSYTVYAADTGKEMDIILDSESDITLTAPGMYRGSEDADGLIFEINVVSPATTPSFSDNVPQIVNNMGFWGVTNVRLRGERMAAGGGAKVDMITGWNNNVSSAVVVDLRTEDEIKASGVPAITSLDQMVQLRENDPGLIIVFDAYIEDNTSGSSGSIKTVFVTATYRRTVGMNSIVYASSSPRSGDTMLAVRSLTAELGEEVKVSFDTTEAAGAGFYRFGVDANGKLALLPFDSDTVTTGNYGMIAMHNAINEVEVIDAGTARLITSDAHGGCTFKCADSAVEAEKNVLVTKDTLILDMDGSKIDVADLPGMLQANDLSINYYCDTPVYSGTTTGRDTSAELVVIAEKSEVKISCDGNHEGWTAISAAQVIDQPGNYYLTGDITDLIDVSGTKYCLNVTADDVKLCLCGHNIKAASSAGGAIRAAGGLTLVNCKGREGGKITGHTGRAILVLNGAEVTIENAVHVDDTVTTNATQAPIQVNTGGKLIMNGGTISKNTNRNTTDSFYGGAVWINGGEFEMNGGVISDNVLKTKKGFGAGIYVKGTFTMTGGTISGNGDTTNTVSGGGVYLQDGSIMTISGDAYISGNKAKTSGAGVHVAGASQLIMNGGHIDNNISNSRGGGVELEGGSATKLAVLEMNAGTISGNQGNNYGGGVSLRHWNKFTMNGGAIIGNKLTPNKHGTQISVGGNKGNNTSVGTFIMNGGTIDDAGNAGYAVPICQGTVTITGGTIIGTVGTVATLNSPATLIIEGGKFVGQVSKGVIPLPSGTARGSETLTITAGTFSVDPTQYLDTDAYEAVAQPNGEFTVQAK